MEQKTRHLVLATVAGIVAGNVLGRLFVPDPTSLVAYGLATVVGVATAAGVYLLYQQRASRTVA